MSTSKKQDETVKTKRKRLTKSRTTERLVQQSFEKTSASQTSLSTTTTTTKKLSTGKKQQSSQSMLVESSSSASDSSASLVNTETAKGSKKDLLMKAKKHAKSMEIDSKSSKLTTMNVEHHHHHKHPSHKENEQLRELRELRNFAFLRFAPPMNKKKTSHNRKQDKSIRLRFSCFFNVI